MNINDYLITLDNRSQWRGDPVHHSLEPAFTNNGTLKLYEILLLVKLKNGSFQGVKQAYYVLDEGGSGETIYPVVQERQDESPNPFKDQIRAYIDANHINATRPKVVINSVNEENEFAIVTAYEIDVDDKIITKQYFLAKDDQETPYIKEYVG